LRDLCTRKSVPGGIIPPGRGQYTAKPSIRPGNHAFGLWKKKKLNALDYEARLRAEMAGRMKSRFRHEHLVDI